jgi:hypothetical protein
MVRRNLGRKVWFGFNVFALLVPRFVHEIKEEKIPLVLEEPTITDVQVLTSRIKAPPPTN